MQVLPTSINPNDPKFKENAAHHRALADELHSHLVEAKEGGGAKYRRRQEEQGKLFVRERIARLLDPGAPFLELSSSLPRICTTARQQARVSSRASGAFRGAK